MTNAEFLEVTREIEKFFDKELTTEQSKVWLEELKKLSKERYRQISREVYRTLKFMPKLADIVEINKTLPSPEKKEANKIYECSKCNGTGFVTYTKVMPEYNNYPYQFAARCTCLKGARLSKDIPTIAQVGMDYEI